MEKRAQAQIITTVLIILLVITAIIIVAAVVRPFIQEGTGGVAGLADCFIVDVEIAEASAIQGNELKLDRGVGEGEIAGIQIFVDGQLMGSSAVSGLDPLETGYATDYTIPLTAEYIRIAKLLGDDLEGATLCDADGNSRDNSGKGVRVKSDCTAADCTKCDASECANVLGCSWDETTNCTALS
ncbi:hypothetical protein GOV14_06305 [Candidatus Pacearchaeota archaeon]|nr:hypothetical protein [Candidatus Pacearchaeota archaeon]